MDPSFVRPLDESLIRELPQLQSLRIAPLRQPVSSRTLSVPSPLEPSASGVRESSAAPKNSTSSTSVPETLPTLTEFLNDAGPEKNDSSVDSLLNFEPPPKPILPAFVNLRSLERFPYSSFDDDSTHARKRRRLDVQPDSFSEHLQLPRPQAQKEQRPPPFGPFAILNGLNEPPPNAALLPPIEADSIPQILNTRGNDNSGSTKSVHTGNLDVQTERREGRIEEILDSPLDDKVSHAGRENPENRHTRLASEQVGSGSTENGAGNDHQKSTEKGDEPLSPKSRGRSRKNTRKWTQEETTALLRGVVKCGIGNWKAILAQPELKFNKRTACNLKDRFRVCCPWAYRAADPNEATKQLQDTLANALLRSESQGSDGTAGKIHLPHPRSVNYSAESNSLGGSSMLTSRNEPPSGSTPTESDSNDFKSRAMPSSSSKATLELLGMPEAPPTMGTRRRARQPFTAAEDEALLKGYAVHGFQWTLIQQDKRLNLSHRRATDLRDRFRNKFPEAYRDGGSVSGKTLQGQNRNSEKGADSQAATNKKKSQNSRRDAPGNRITDASREADSSSGDTPHDKGKGSQAANAKTKSKVTRQQMSLNTNGTNAKETSTRPTGSTDSSLARPQALLPDASAHFQILLDDNSTGVSNVDAPWEDNTLAPMIWDELP
ncbi:MYB DNA-binding domain protein [Aspergillus sclerotialis]|uniref:MYB DNA-binding domain protein n=1 Tax=Aspergillus sclerotialis TaxID=2070753 RepID=A0A3A2Z3A4_9EURO|nr:MYB DNA-binding domain protein [Aspergillus sclerotialis]